MRRKYPKALPRRRRSNLADFVYRAPPQPAEIWLRAAGGQIYDNWWDALDRKKPEGSHPAYPKIGPAVGRQHLALCGRSRLGLYGKNGLYGVGERYTGIKGIRGAAGRT